MHTQKSSTVEKVWMGRMELPQVVRRVQWRQPDPHAAAAAARGQEGGGRARREARASRHTPITLLNTDTSNIRAMVQQFTGIPLGPYGPGGGPLRRGGGGGADYGPQLARPSMRSHTGDAASRPRHPARYRCAATSIQFLLSGSLSVYSLVLVQLCHERIR
ncbi:LOW QUALITY PROTEIN: hypothetical protein BDA96_05G147100 [Sorghum bicolor]|uniref:VQ domain-containing protein n=1 Tax=Sorghum bicolor TaxID=4558 RepID=A0A921UFF0_SORBI|nr:LOW QUALITY PROTEIN: hypothetical protein BDA96_05G147100 [Sorghum bicolor]